MITQGFIGESEEGYTSTLGREGSDYSASVIAYFKNAKMLYLHKDVKGLHSIDPKIKKTKNVLEKVFILKLIIWVYLVLRLFIIKRLNL